MESPTPEPTRPDVSGAGPAAPDSGDETAALRRSGLARLSTKLGQKLWGVVHDEADEAAAKAALRSGGAVWLFRGFVVALVVGLVLAAAGVI